MLGTMRNVKLDHDNPLDLSWGGPYWVTPIH